MKRAFALIPPAMAVLLAGCGKTASSHALPQPPRVAQCQPGRPGGTLKLALAGNPQTFNPLFAFDAASDAAARLMSGSLVNIDMVSQEPGPGLAQSWSVTPDGKTWTFKLRNLLRWSDGAPLTADDVVFTWNELMYNPRYNPLTYGLFRIDGRNFQVTKVDSQTVRVVTPEVFAPFLAYFGRMEILPRHILEASARSGNFPAAYGVHSPPNQVVTCGPFRLKEFLPGHFVRLERNPEYWAVDKTGRRLPYFDEVDLEITPDPQAAAQLCLAGGCDVCENVPDGDWARFHQASAAGRIRLVDLGAGLDRDFLWFNQNTGSNSAGRPLVAPAKLKWFRNKIFRQAVSCAINRARIVTEVYGGRAQPAYGLIPAQNQKWINPSVERYSHDPDRARALLAQIGMRRGASGALQDSAGTPVAVTLIFGFGNPVRAKMAALVQQDLRQVGIQVRLEPLEFRALLGRVNSTFDYECALMGLAGGGTDPASQMNVLESGAPLHQWFPAEKTPASDWEAKIDSLMQAQMRTLDFSRRKKDFDQVQAIWADEQPMIAITAPFSSAALRPGIGNVRQAATCAYPVTWNIEELFFQH